MHMPLFNSVLCLCTASCRDPSTNPFNIPADEDIFRHREDDRQRMTQKRLLALQQPVSEKTTLASRMQVDNNCKCHPAPSRQSLHASLATSCSCCCCGAATWSVLSEEAGLSANHVRMTAILGNGLMLERVQ
eukprot:scaffold200012_cov14-Tisochrysis_lutea.AAC.1